MAGFKPKRNTMLRKALGDPAREQQIADENASGMRWVIDGNLRRVPPYFFTYLTFCKQRWIGQTLLNVFTKEFRDRTPEYYARAIDRGLVLVNGSKANRATVLSGGDLVMHRTHKHEPPVPYMDTDVKIVFQNDELVVIDKPAGVPVHATGRFKFNTVVSLILAQLGCECHPCNRLDRLTSGLMFLAKTPAAADEIGGQIRDREVAKEYLALCYGDVGSQPFSCDLPLRTLNPKLTLNMVDYKEGKPSSTEFVRISYDKKSNMSLVLCKPKTGRTHQIRVHLQHLGFPIANDPIYSSEKVWGPLRGKGADASNTELIEKVTGELDLVGRTQSATSAAFPNASGEVLSGEKCEECETPLYTDPGPNDRGIWLHALRYRSSKHGWDYTAELAPWAVDIHKPFMELALEEAKKAPDLPGAFAVGAVLAHNGEVLATGYTRELEGNTHAEQNALEKLRLAGKELPEGTCLYTTMEPCTERLSGNEPCCERVLKHPAIRTVFVGVTEPSDFIAENTSKARLEKAGIVYLQVPGVAEEALRIAKKGHTS